MNEKQFAAWKMMFGADPEYANEVLQYFRDLVTPLPTPDEAIANLCQDDGDEPLPLGIANHPAFGLADIAAKKLAEMA
jgi:hypothetical protein